MENSCIERKDYIDYIKGIGIFLVIIGHTGSYFWGWIYSFHMGLFFWTAGYVMALKGGALLILEGFSVKK